MAARYEGRIEHNNDSIHALFKTQYYTYQFGRVVRRTLLGVALIAAALFAGLPIWAEAILLAIGCWMLVGRDFPATYRAEEAIDARKGVLPITTCSFSAGHAEIQEGGVSKKLRYDQFQKLVQDKDYLYLFLGEESIVMIDREKVEPGTDAELMEFIEKKTGKKWEARLSLLTMNLHDLLRMTRKKRGK